MMKLLIAALIVSANVVDVAECAGLKGVAMRPHMSLAHHHHGHGKKSGEHVHHTSPNFGMLGTVISAMKDQVQGMLKQKQAEQGTAPAAPAAPAADPAPAAVAAPEPTADGSATFAAAVPDPAPVAAVPDPMPAPVVADPMPAPVYADPLPAPVAPVQPMPQLTAQVPLAPLDASTDVNKAFANAIFANVEDEDETDSDAELEDIDEGDTFVSQVAATPSGLPAAAAAPVQFSDVGGTAAAGAGAAEVASIKQQLAQEESKNAGLKKRKAKGEDDVVAAQKGAIDKIKSLKVELKKLKSSNGALLQHGHHHAHHHKEY